MRTTLAVVIAVLVSGCTTWHIDETWKKADVGISKATADDWQCRRTASDRRLTPNLFVGGFVDAARVVVDQELIEHAYARCMQELGYARG